TRVRVGDAAAERVVERLIGYDGIGADADLLKGVREGLRPALAEGLERRLWPAQRVIRVAAVSLRQRARGRQPGVPERLVVVVVPRRLEDAPARHDEVGVGDVEQCAVAVEGDRERTRHAHAGPPTGGEEAPWPRAARAICSPSARTRPA